MGVTPSGLVLHGDRAMLPTGTIGYFLLIDGDLLTNAACAVNDTTNEFTATAPHGLVTGTRIRVATSGGTLPAPLSPSVDYFVAVVSASIFQVCSTLANAIASTPVPIDLNSQGSNLAINEQALLDTDYPPVILAHECSGNNYSRHPATAIGPSVVGSNGKASKAPITWAQQALGGPITYKHVAFLDGGNATVGDTTGVLSHLSSLANIVTIADTVNQSIGFQFGTEN